MYTYGLSQRKFSTYVFLRWSETIKKLFKSRTHENIKNMYKNVSNNTNI